MDLSCTCIHASDNVGLLAALTDKSEGLVLASEEKVGLIPKKFVFINKLDKGNYVGISIQFRQNKIIKLQAL